MNASSRWWWCRTGWVMPALILALLVSDGALRLVPLRFFAFRAWEGLLHGDQPHRVFAPDQHVHSPRCYGDLASAANRRDLREYHVEDFTTDALGFRNPPGLSEHGPISVLVNGNSFAVGVGVSDDETLGARLTERLGVGVYTVAGVPTPRVADLVALRPHLAMQSGGVLLHVYLEGYELKGPEEQEQPAYRFDLPPRSQLVENFWISRLSILALQEKKWLRPHWHEEGVAVRTLRNGQPILFPAPDLAHYADESPPDVGAWRWLGARVEREGLALIVVLVPDKFTVYAPLLRKPPPRPRVQRVDRLEELLRAAGVRVINLKPIFEARAAEELDQGRTIYWRDDTHWNARGIELAADEIAKELRRSP